MVNYVRKNENRGIILKIEYHNKDVQRYCEDIHFAEKNMGRLPAIKLIRLMDVLRKAHHILDFTKEPKLKPYQLHDLYGDMKGMKALKIDYAYRMELIVLVYAQDGEDDIIKIMEVSKHYGK